MLLIVGIQGIVRFFFNYNPLLYSLFKHQSALGIINKTDLIKTLLFIVIAFVFYNKEILHKVQDYKNKISNIILFSFLSLFSLSLYYYIRYFANIYTNTNIVLLTTIKVILLISYITCLIFAIFNIKTIKEFIKKFNKQIVVFSALFVLYYLAVHYSLSLWSFFSSIVAKLSETTFSLFYQTKISYTNLGPLLTIENFKVLIGAPCSGIDSMLLFTTLFFLIFFLDYKKINKKTMLLLFPFGLIGMFFFNILRIILLLLIGLHISEDFAVGLFHQNIGWLIFIIYFVIFYLITRKWIYKN